MKIIVLCCLLTFYGCTSKHVTTTWKAGRVTAKYNHVLVVAIVPGEDSNLRKKIELDFSAGLETMGYNALPAFSTFGFKGLSGLGEENTYLKLCSNGIDAVLIVALVNKTRQTYQTTGKTYIYPNSYYYRRIWNYSNLTDDDVSPKKYFWESILFNLSTLEAVTTIRTTPFIKTGQETINNKLAAMFIKKLYQEKVLRKQEPIQFKAF
jgi:hypothetical protein